MTRTYALKRLLEHGPMHFADLVYVTGWTPKAVSSALQALEKSGLLVVGGNRGKFVYSLT